MGDRVVRQPSPAVPRQALGNGSTGCRQKQARFCRLPAAGTLRKSPTLPQATFEVQTAESLPYPDSSYDTVVDTFGLCSVESPSAALAEMIRVCRPGGKILLLEHGRSGYWTALDMLLDKYSVRHAERWGCWWNRDVAGIVASQCITGSETENSKDISQQALAVIEEATTHHLGTTQVYCLRRLQPHV